MGISRKADPNRLSSAELARRLAELAGEERQTQVEFLLHLDAFDRRRGWLEAGYGSLWTYCLEVLHLRESAAGRRIGAMKVLRRFPSLERALRDGRLCLTTVNLLGPVLTDGNLDALVGRAAFLSKADTERLVVSIQPRVAPKEGIRKVSSPTSAIPSATSPLGVVLTDGPWAEAHAGLAEATSEAAPSAALALERVPAPAPRHELRPLSADTYSLRITVDAACKADLDQLVSLLSHKTNGNLAEVLREAIRCGIAKHGKRRGAVEPERPRSKAPEAAPASATEARMTSAAAPMARPSAPPGGDPRAIPMWMLREVWKRDGGRCAWVSPDGKRCGSAHKLEVGHLTPAALGRAPTVDGLRLECRAHNQLEAVRFFGPQHMAPYLGEFATPGGSHPG